MPSDIPEALYDGRVFVLTDAATVWGESVGLPLPSGLGAYRIPVSVIRQPRSALGGLPPDIAWPGAKDDEEGIRAWIADLAKRPDIAVGGEASRYSVH